MKIEIKKMNNGYLVEIEDANQLSGPYVYKTTEEFKLLETIGFVILNQKIKVELR